MVNACPICKATHSITVSGGLNELILFGIFYKDITLMLFRLPGHPLVEIKASKAKRHTWNL